MTKTYVNYMYVNLTPLEVQVVSRALTWFLLADGLTEPEKAAAQFIQQRLWEGD